MKLRKASKIKFYSSNLWSHEERQLLKSKIVKVHSLRTHLSSRMASSSSLAASKGYFEQLKKLAEKLDNEVVRLETEVRNRVLTTKSDESGFAAPICDEISDAIDEMSSTVDALSLEVEKNTQNLDQVLTDAVDHYDQIRSKFCETVDLAAKYGYEITAEDQELIDDDFDVESVEKQLQTAPEPLVNDDVLQSPNLFAMGLSKSTLESLGIHFRREKSEESLAIKRPTPPQSPLSSVKSSPKLQVSETNNDLSDDDDSFGYLAPSILKTPATKLDVSMEQSRVEISPGLKVKKRQVTKKTKTIDDSTDLCEFSTHDVHKMLKEYNRKEEKKEETNAESSPELPILKTMDISKMFQKQDEVLKDDHQSPSPIRKPIASKENIEVPQSPNEDAIMAIINKYSN